MSSHARADSDQPSRAQLRVDRPTEGVVVLTLDNPEMRNAMSDEMTASWTATLQELASDHSVRVVVVTGAGSAFCSGGNTSWIASEPDASVDRLRTRMLPFYRAWLSIRSLEVPTIAAVNGPAIGAGLCLALACDLRYAATGARLGAPFVSLGMHAGMAGTYLLPNVVGPAHARDLLLTGRVVDADEALRLGLVSRVLAPETFLEQVLEVAGQIARTAPIASRLTTLALRDGGHADFESALQWEALAQPVTLATADLQEGIAAARERRAPQFCGGSRPRDGEEAPSPHRHLPSPCECRRMRPGPHLGATLGSVEGYGQRGAAHPCGQPGENAVDNPAGRWTRRGGARDSAVDDRARTTAYPALTSDNECPPGVERRKSEV
ncbi:MAG: enoyl-CoA hydratase/isomerase family protein [Nocardioides sp.]